MGILALAADERVKDVSFSEDALSVALMDGRTITVPLTWYPRLLKASFNERSNWEICGGGYGIHWPDIDEDLSTEGLLRGAPAPPSVICPVEFSHCRTLPKARLTQRVAHHNPLATKKPFKPDERPSEFPGFPDYSFQIFCSS